MLSIIGGTGLYKLPGLEVISKQWVETPFGRSSSEIVLGSFLGKKIIFMARHGEGHSHLPHEINYRANIFALKKLGARAVLSVSAVGSLRGSIHPGDLVCIDQYIDFTKGRRAATFFGEGVSAHISTAFPASPVFQSWIKAPGDRNLHRSGCYVCVEGPRLGTRFESLMFRSWGADVVGMTNVPEAFLAREAQMPYQSIGIATDYDSWMEDVSQHVDVSKIFVLYRESMTAVVTLISHIVECFDPVQVEQCDERRALQNAVLTKDASLTEIQSSWLSVLRI